MTLEVSDMCDCACVTDTNFLWENSDKCIRQWEIFIRTSEPQDSVKGLTGIVDIFEQSFGKDIVQKL